MSRIGKKPVALPESVSCVIGEAEVEVKGPRGLLRTPLADGIDVAEERGVLTVTRAAEDKGHRARPGVVRSLLETAVIGVTQGFSKDLEIIGIGYRAAKEGKQVTFNLGFSHAKVYAEPDDVKIDI